MMQTKRRQRGMTLAELVISSATSLVLVAGLTSTLYLATTGADTNDDTMNTLDGSWIAEQIALEVETALYFKERSATSIKFVAADQDGDGAPDTIYYSWSGVAGDPVTRQFNEAAPDVIAADVHQFSLAYIVAYSTELPRVMLVVSDDASLSNEDQAKKDLFESWGYSVSVVDDNASATTYDDLISTSQVAYVSEESLSGNVNIKLRDASLGVVCEERTLYDEFKLSTSSGIVDDDSISIDDNTHYITSVFSTGNLKITNDTFSQELTYVGGTVGSGKQILASKTTSSSSVLVVFDYATSLLDGHEASGRRVILPWGGNAFEFEKLTADGQTIVKRSMEWVAGDYDLTGVEISLQIESSANALVETTVDVLNRTRVTGA